MENNTFKTRQEIADKYGISVKTLLSRLLKNGYALNSG